MELLSQGRQFQWERKEIGVSHASWDRYAVSKRTIVYDYDLTGFRHANKIIAPTNRTFPVVDFVSPSALRNVRKRNRLSYPFNALGAKNTKSSCMGCVLCIKNEYTRRTHVGDQHGLTRT